MRRLANKSLHQTKPFVTHLAFARCAPNVFVGETSVIWGRQLSVIGNRAYVVSLLIFLSLLLAGCSGERSEVRVQVHSGKASYPNIHVQLLDSERTRQLDLDHDTRSAGPFKTSTSGNLTVSCWVDSEEQDSEPSGSIALSIREGWRWGVVFTISTEDPIDGCFGCTGSEGFELDPTLGYAPEEKLYVTWGGNSINNPVVY